MINIPTTMWMKAVNDPEGALHITLKDLPPKQNTQGRCRRQMQTPTRNQVPPPPKKCVLKTFGSGIDKFP